MRKKTKIVAAGLVFFLSLVVYKSDLIRDCKTITGYRTPDGGSVLDRIYLTECGDFIEEGEDIDLLDEVRNG